MTKTLIAPAAIALALGLAACNPYDPGQRALGGAASSAGTGAAIGAASGATAGLISSLFGGAQVSPAYKSFVERCLRERGYDIVGWD